MHRLALVLAALALGLAAPGSAAAQFGNQPLIEPPAPPPPPAQKFEDEGLSALQTALIFGSAALVIGTIGFVIMRDARRAAPVEDGPRSSGTSGQGGAGAAGGAASVSTSASRARDRERAKRAKAKARHTRQQRKNNRPR